LNKIRVVLVTGLALGMVALGAPARADGPPTGAITGSHGRVTKTVYHPTNRSKFVQIAVDTHFGYNTATADADADFVSPVGRISKGSGALRVQLDRLRLGYEANAKPVVDDFRPIKGTPRNRNNGRLPADPLNSASDYEPDVSQVLGSGDWVSVFCDDARVATRAFFTVRWNDGSLSGFSERSNYVDVDLNGCPPPGPSADLRVTKTATVASVPEDRDTNFAYTIAVSNLDSSDSAFNVATTDTLPATVDLNGPLPSNCADTDAGAPVRVVCTFGTVLPGETESVTLNVTADGSPTVIPGTSISNTATVSSDTADPNSANNSSTNTIAVEQFADLAVDKFANDGTETKTTYTKPDDDFVYQVNVQNNGPSPATGIVMTDTLPAGLDAPTGFDPTDNCTYNATTRVITCRPSITLPPGFVRIIVFATSTNNGATGDLVNTATVDSSESDRVTANNTDSYTLTPAP
jgi:uncharacterized repeat protein (TIGR01451 family)